MAAEDKMPATDGLRIVPAVGLCLVHIQDDVVMVGHDGVGADIERKDRGERAHSLLNPIPAMFVAYCLSVCLRRRERRGGHSGRRNGSKEWPPMRPEPSLALA